MRKLLSKEAAQPIIEPVLFNMSKVFDDCLDTFQNVLSVFGGPMNSRTKATVFHNLIINRAKIEFQSSNTIKIYEDFETITLVLSERIAGRFKKLDKFGQPCNTPTERNKNIVTQQHSINYTEYPSMTFLDFGYIINDTWTAFERISVSCNLNRVSVWTIEITNGSDGRIISSADNNPVLPIDDAPSVWKFTRK